MVKGSVYGERGALAKAITAVRQHRGLRRRDVAAAMSMPLRSYYDFENGEGAMDYDRLQAFAAVTDCDLVALLLCSHLERAQFALDCADNKAATIALGQLEDLRSEIGCDFSALRVSELVGAFEQARERLSMEARTRIQGGGSPPCLTERQLECLAWVQAGKSSHDIGGILGVSYRTIDDHVRRACHKLGVRTRVQAISRAISLGYLAP